MQPGTYDLPGPAAVAGGRGRPGKSRGRVVRLGRNSLGRTRLPERALGARALARDPGETVLPAILGAAGRAVSRCLRRRSSRSEEHTSELQSLMRNSYAVFCLKKKRNQQTNTPPVTPLPIYTTINNHT